MIDYGLSGQQAISLRPPLAWWTLSGWHNVGNEKLWIESLSSFVRKDK